MSATTSVDEIVASASALTDVADPAPSHFLANLTAVVDHLNEEAALTDTGLQGIVGQLVPALRNRMEVDAYVAEHPEVDAEPLPAPIFLTGLPRSGTTYFQYLFDQDPRLRMLRTWEGERPSPPPASDGPRPPPAATIFVAAAPADGPLPSPPPTLWCFHSTKNFSGVPVVP